MQHIRTRRTVQDILRYIRAKNTNGVLQESMMTISKNTSYSNATIHRSLKELEKEGYIKIIPTKSQKHPNKIFYIGPDEGDVDDLLIQAQKAVEELNKATGRVQSVMEELRHTVSLLQSEDADFIQLH